MRYAKWVAIGVVILGLLAVIKFGGKKKVAEIYETRDGKKITTVIYASDLEAKLKNVNKDYIEKNGEYEVKKQILDTMIDRELLLKDLKKNNFSEEVVLKQWETQKKEIRLFYFAQEYIANEKMIKIPETELTAYYEKEKERFKVEEQVKASHILIKSSNVRSDADAKAQIVKVIAEIKADASNFGELAKKYSEDGSSQMEGDLGFFPRNRMVPEFETAAFALKKGEFTKEPVKTQFGYHIILVTDRKEAGYTPMADVKKDIRMPVYTEMVKKEYEVVVYADKIDVKVPDAVIGETKKIKKTYTINSLKEMIKKNYPGEQMVDSYFAQPEYVSSILTQMMLIDAIEDKMNSFGFDDDKKFKKFESDEYKNFLAGFYQNELMKKIEVTDDEARQAYLGNSEFMDMLAQRFGAAIKTNKSFREQKEKEFLGYVKQQIAAGKQQQFYSTYIGGLKQEYPVVIHLKEPKMPDLKKIKKDTK